MGFPQVRLQMEEILGHVVEERGKDLDWFSRSGFGLLRQFLRAIRPTFQIQWMEGNSSGN